MQLVNFPKVNIQPCIPTAPPPPDNRCSDPTYALLNPDKCAASPLIRVKPEVLVVCVLGSIQFQAFQLTNGTETPLTSGVIWSSSNPAVAVVGVNSGNATGLSAGMVTITATVGTSVATASLSVIGALSGSNGQGPPLIPAMTSNTAPSGQSSAGSSFGGVDTSWKAFDNNPNTFWPSGQANTWLQYHFPSGVVADTLELFGDFSAWTLGGSNNGTTFTTLASGPSGVSASVQSANFTNSASYQYYRLTFAGPNASAVISMQLSKRGSGNTCCDASPTATVLLVDKSLSMSLGFGSGYTTKQAFADYLASTYAQQTNTGKDQVALIEFDSAATTDSGLTSSTSVVSTEALNIVNSTNKTSLAQGLQTAATLLAGSLSATKVIVLISDGENNDITTDPTAVATAFKNNGGLILCVGVRAHGDGFNLLSVISTGGFFVNAYPENVAAAIELVFGLKGYMCSGNSGQCDAGNKFMAMGEPNYSTFANWNIVGTPAATCTPTNPGLFGPGYLDLLPGNGLYVSLTPCTPQFQSKSSFAFVPGKTYRISFDLAGNNQQDAGTQRLTVQVGNGSQFKQILLLPDYKTPFTRQTFAFTVPLAETSPILFFASGGSNTAIGPLLNNVELDDVTNGNVMFQDDFDGENLQYLPPACGGGLKVEPNVPVVTDVSSAVSCSDADGAAFLTLAGITDLPTVNAVCTLVTSLKSAGLWNSIDALYPFVGGTSLSNSLNLRDTSKYQITWHGSVTFNANGITGDGATGYGDTGFNPSTAISPKYSLDSASIGVNYGTFSSFGSGIGASHGADFIPISAITALYSFPGDQLYGPNSSTNTNVPAGVAVPGLYAGSRTSSTLATYYYPGSSIANNATSTFVPDMNIYVAAHNSSGGVAGKNGNTLSLAWIGGAFNGTQMAQMQSINSAFQTALGRS